MHPSIPVYLSLFFGLTVLLTIVWFYRVTQSKPALVLIGSWLLIQSAIGLNGFYTDVSVMPPRLIVFGILPTLLMMISLFILPQSRQWMNQVDLKRLTYFHTIRIPVEIVLSLLYYQGVVSVLMTFEGTNFDILSGLSAPVIAYLFFKKEKLNTKGLLVWNVICLLLLLNVVITAVLSFPTPFQQFAFDQPNIGVLYFPFLLLPVLVVPLVLLSHFIAIRQLILKLNK